MLITRYNKILIFTVIVFLSLVLTRTVFSHEPLIRTSSTAINTIQHTQSQYPVIKIPGVGRAAESYFSPNSKSLIFYGKPGDAPRYQIHVVNTDGSHFRRLNDKGNDACSFFFPDGKRVVFTSTMDNPDMPKGNWSDSENYPRGAEIYTANLDGSNLKRITANKYYDAEVSVSPDGKWILFSRQVDGKLDLWRMKPDGSAAKQITKTPDLQEGGAFYMPDSETIIFRAWSKKEQGKTHTNMQLYTIKHDGTQLIQHTHDKAVNWSPFPAPDGKHVVYAKLHPPYNFEIHLLNLKTGVQQQLTSNQSFDGFPSISPDGNTLSFSSSRNNSPGSRMLQLYLMDISELGLQAKPGPVISKVF